MAGYTGDMIGRSEARAFISEQWQSEIMRYRMEDLMLAGYVYTIDFGQKRGDSIRRPRISRLGVNQKSPKSPIEYQALTEQEWRMKVDRYTYSAIMVEDIAELQAHTNLRAEYTKEIGVALARDLDYAIMAQRAAIINYNGAVDNQTTSNSHITSASAIGRTQILTAMEVLDRRRVPRQGRVMFITPAHISSFMTIPEFTSRDFITGSPTETGVIGSIYGMPVKVDNNITQNSTTLFTNGDNGVGSPTPGVANSMYFPTQEDFTVSYGLPTVIGAGTSIHSAMILHPEAIAMAVQKRPNVEAVWDIDYQAWKVASTQVYDLKLYRQDHAVVISTNEA